MWHVHLFSVWMYWAFALNPYFSDAGDESILYDLSGYDFVYEPGDDVRGPDILTGD